MPIRPELRAFYTGPAWQATRQRILARARHRCEACGVPNRTRVARASGWWVIPTEEFFREMWMEKLYGVQEGKEIPPPLYWTDPHGKTVSRPAGFPYSICRDVQIVIAVTHLNNTSGDDRDENLMARCQWCHLTSDERFHKLTRSIRKDAARPLLQEARA